ncbi:hypothetical protein FRC05_010037 [Tulasnella sp. 425]|nr:hypothetical protein FRC05_010037 [Tulasnella sp. 425]
MRPPDSLRLPSIHPSRGQDVPRLPNIRELLSSTSAPTSPPSDPSASPPGRSSSSSPLGSARLPPFPNPNSLDFLPSKPPSFVPPFDRSKRPRLDKSGSPPRADRSGRLAASGPYERVKTEERKQDPPGPRWQTPDPDPPTKPVFQYSTRQIVPIRVAAPPVTNGAAGAQPVNRSPPTPVRTTSTIGGTPPRRTP